MILVEEIHLDRHCAGGSVQRLDDTGDRALEEAIGIGLGANLCVLTHPDERDVFLDDLDQNADRLDLMEGENPARDGGGAGGCSAVIGAQIWVSLDHLYPGVGNTIRVE